MRKEGIETITSQLHRITTNFRVTPIIRKKIRVKVEEEVEAVVEVVEVEEEEEEMIIFRHLVIRMRTNTRLMVEEEVEIKE